MMRKIDAKHRRLPIAKKNEKAHLVPFHIYMKLAMNKPTVAP